MYINIPNHNLQTFFQERQNFTGKTRIFSVWKRILTNRFLEIKINVVRYPPSRIRIDSGRDKFVWSAQTPENVESGIGNGRVCSSRILEIFLLSIDIRLVDGCRLCFLSFVPLIFLNYFLYFLWFRHWDSAVYADNVSVLILRVLKIISSLFSVNFQQLTAVETNINCNLTLSSPKCWEQNVSCDEGTTIMARIFALW